MAWKCCLDVRIGLGPMRTKLPPRHTPHASLPIWPQGKISCVFPAHFPVSGGSGTGIVGTLAACVVRSVAHPERDGARPTPGRAGTIWAIRRLSVSSASRDPTTWR